MKLRVSYQDPEMYTVTSAVDAIAAKMIAVGQIGQAIQGLAQNLSNAHDARTFDDAKEKIEFLLEQGTK